MSASPADPPILVVEDDVVAQEGLTTILEAQGYRVIVASDALAAINLLLAGLRPSLILLDMILPGSDGWQFFAERLRNPELTRIPVVIMTGVGIASPEWALALGAVALLRKPIAVEGMLAVIRQHAGQATALPEQAGSP